MSWFHSANLCEYVTGDDGKQSRQYQPALQIQNNAELQGTFRKIASK